MIDKGKTRVILRKSQQSNSIHTDSLALAYQMDYAVAVTYVHANIYIYIDTTQQKFEKENYAQLAPRLDTIC